MPRNRRYWGFGLETDIARKKLDWWEDEISNVLDAPTHPITIALRKAIESVLSITDLLKIIGGVRQDLNHKPITSFTELESYSDHVAGAVGRYPLEFSEMFETQKF